MGERASDRQGVTVLPLGERWLQCLLVYSAGEAGALPPGREHEAETALQQHLETYPDAARHNVWFDEISACCFSGAQIRGGPCGKDYNFLAERDDFLDSLWGRRYIEGSVGCNDVFRTYPVTYDTEHARGHPASFDAFRGQRVLIVLGGPTTRRVPWENFETDCLWSCNKFYLSPRVQRADLALVALAPDVALDEPALHRYLETHDTKAAFELERGGPVGSWLSVNTFVGRFADRCAFFHTRYQSALGLGTRLILFAIFLGASEVAFVGLDGMTPNGPLHSFEPYKANPLWYHRFGPALQRRQYVVFWEYVLGLRANYGFGLCNLGEMSTVNLSKTISERHFPLAPAVRRRLKDPPS